MSSRVLRQRRRQGRIPARRGPGSRPWSLREQATRGHEDQPLMGHRRSVDRSASALEDDVDVAQAGGPTTSPAGSGTYWKIPPRPSRARTIARSSGYRCNTADGCARRRPGRMPTPMLPNLSSERPPRRSRRHEPRRRPARSRPGAGVNAAGSAQLPAAIHDLVLDDQRLRSETCWSIFDC
jgi:hypothetical protein